MVMMALHGYTFWCDAGGYDYSFVDMPPAGPGTYGIWGHAPREKF